VGIETYVCGQLMGINPLNQPGVEEGKILTYSLLGRKGFEDRAGEEEWTQKAHDKHFIL
jgi:glucose-6-phosphate isomerase